MTDSRKTEKAPYESVRQNAGDASPVPPNVYQPRSSLEKIGKKNALVLLLGSVAIFFALAWLIFLWVVPLAYGAKGKDVSPLWLLLVKQNFQTRVVTLASTLIRAAATAQLCCFAAIMAALILEKSGTSANHFPSLSMIRCSNSGPKALVSHVWHNKSKASQLGYSVLIILAVLNALALQFTSTILLGDFGDSPITFGEKNETTQWGLTAKTNEYILKGNDFWRAGQTVYPPIAEYREPWSNDSTSSDTGKTYRGFIPFANQTIRDSMLIYQGPMTVVDERVVCVKPEVSNITFHAIQILEGQPYGDFSLGGNININGTHRDVVQGNDVNAFNCTMPTAGYALGLWPIAICSLSQGFARLKGGIVDEPTGFTDGIVDTGNASAWLFLNLTAPDNFTYTDWLPLNLSGNSMPLTQLSSSDGPWSGFGHNSTSISLSLCLFNPQTDVYEVTASGSTYNWQEDDIIHWDTKSSTYYTDAARFQLGAMRGEELREYEEYWAETMEIPNGTVTQDVQRGVLLLDNSANWTANKSSATYSAETLRWMDTTLDKIKPVDYQINQQDNDTFQLTPFDYDYGTIHKSYQAIAQDVFQSTLDPALTLQTLTHLVLQTAYYDWLPNFDVNGTSVYYILEFRNIPVSWVRFSVIMALLGLHFLLLVVASVLFLATTEMSLLGNAWHTVAQVHSPDTADTIQRAHMATDDELTEIEKKAGLSEGHILIRRSDRNGRHEAAVIGPRYHEP